MKLQNAPIKEAVFDIRIDKINIQKPEELLKIRDFLSGNFPELKNIHKVHGTIQLKDGISIKSDTKSDLNGFSFISKDKSKQIQVRLDGFTLNVLKPYESWETHFSEFIVHWETYSKLFAPNKILRIATRFINRIEIPIPFTRFEDYLNVVPAIPKSLPKSIKNFFLQVQVPCDDGYREAILTQAIEPRNNNTLPVIIDIDVFQELGLTNDLEKLTTNFNEIRKIKNKIFIDCISEKTLNQYL
ncbi:TIGR04255 family protein [Algoriphagus pacificus]|uniref:TIGR04255 family protein n=1 Tax=Algoriphagus pacificus TaxID=2811234 RepID=A0ABS3CAS4_9BACT|nr:TIGR04255 family protein [Algoriphagus pacificus]MBN7814208.1 TIGR04255 family protein [Algoriphagus pacificus]